MVNLFQDQTDGHISLRELKKPAQVSIRKTTEHRIDPTLHIGRPGNTRKYLSPKKT
jgi:hypothetical protein